MKKPAKTTTVHISKIIVSPDGEMEILGVFKSRRKAVGVTRTHLRHLFDKTNAAVCIQNVGTRVADNMRTTVFQVSTDWSGDEWIPQYGVVEEVQFFE